MKIHRKVSNKLKGSYGMTEWKKNKVVITINKKLHKKSPTHKKRYPELLDTIVHEEMHARHPKMHEKTVRKLAPKKVAKMSIKSKQKLYRKYK